MHYQFLPTDWQQATLVGRIQTGDGPTPVVLSNGRVFDVSKATPTVSHLLNHWTGAVSGSDIGSVEEVFAKCGITSTPDYALQSRSSLLAPFDLQCIKACGVTFAVSTVERVIEERARGDAAKALSIRQALQERMGGDIRSVKPGSESAMKLKQALIADGLWSQYLEVGIGPDAEVFTKAPVLSSVGYGDWIGVRDDSVWNNPEPEVVLACNSQAKIVGAALGNDVNLRDIEGRSALLLGKAKDNNASCAIGPFIRVFDQHFTLDDVRNAVVTLEVVGDDGFSLTGESSMSLISRDPLELLKQTTAQHQYPDGIALFCGTMFAPTKDRDAAGGGFTHKQGDIVRVASTKLGMLENKVTSCKQAPPWTAGIGELMHNLAKRGLLS